MSSRILKRLFSIKVFVPVVLVFALYTALARGRHTILDARRAEAELETRRAQIRDVSRRADSLQARIDALENDDKVLERTVRERYGFIRDGERLYKVTVPDGEGPAAGETP